jgi:hypothetical protein
MIITLEIHQNFLNPMVSQMPEGQRDGLGKDLDCRVIIRHETAEMRVFLRLQTL